MVIERYACSLCEQELETLGRHRCNCHTIAMRGPTGAHQTVMHDEEWYVRHGDVHICPWCWKGLESLFAKGGK